MGYQLGIDLGTTYSAAAVCRGSVDRWVEPEVVTLGTRSATVPSVLFIGADGTVLVGEAAERRALSDPDRVVREFKRRIGDPTPFVVAGRPWAPEELSALLVRWIVDRVGEREGGPAERIAVTHPASWGAHKKELLAGALAERGLMVTFLAEPQAAALHYSSAERVEPGSTIAVYDLGGGTFDAAVVRKALPAEPADGAGPAGFGMLGRPEGLEQLGGIDFDQSVFDHVMAGMPAAFATLDDTDPAVLAAVSRVRRECTEAKEVLSSDTEVTVPVLLPGAQGSVRLHRSEFEQMILPRIQETVDALRSAVGSAGMTPDDLSTVLLVGGSSRIPLVAQLVSEQLGRPVAVDADPKNGIAKGAALAVAPKPATSWPGVAIAPITGTGAMAPAERLPSPTVAAAAAAGWNVPVPSAPVPSPPSVVGAQIAATGSQGLPALAPARPPVQKIPEWEYDTAPPERRKGPVGLLVGAGGVVAVAAVMVAVLTWPTATPASAGGTVTGPLSVADAPVASGGQAVGPATNPVVVGRASNAVEQQAAAGGPVAPPPAGTPVVAPVAPVVPPVVPPVPPANPATPTAPGPGAEGTGTGTPPGTDPGTGTGTDPGTGTGTDPGTGTGTDPGTGTGTGPGTGTGTDPGTGTGTGTGAEGTGDTSPGTGGAGPTDTQPAPSATATAP